SLMFSHAFKFLCYLVVGLQMAATLASSQGLMLCVHANGFSQIENRATHQECADDQSHPPTADSAVGESDEDCVDLPIGNERAATLNGDQLASIYASHGDFLAVLPPCLQAVSEPSSQTFARAAMSDTPVTDGALQSLNSIILVI
ncbi:MAG: hypothetical protein JWM57_1515, partial [Phycisphaerales bacterium]|nr:hypothetical protein [Phycisphaerales bacterium]